MESGGGLLNLRPFKCGLRPGLWHGTASFSSAAGARLLPRRDRFLQAGFLSISKAFGEAGYLELFETFGSLIILHSRTWLGTLIFCKILWFYFSVSSLLFASKTHSIDPIQKETYSFSEY